MYEEVVRTFYLIKPPNRKFHAKIINYPVNHISWASQAHPASKGFLRLATKKNSIYMHTNAIVIQDRIIHWPWKLPLAQSPFKRIEFTKKLSTTDYLNADVYSYSSTKILTNSHLVIILQHITKVFYEILAVTKIIDNSFFWIYPNFPKANYLEETVGDFARTLMAMPGVHTFQRSR